MQIYTRVTDKYKHELCSKPIRTAYMFFFFCGHFPLSPDQHNFLQKISPDLLSVLRSNVSLIYYYHISLFPLRSCVRNCNFKIRSTITVTIISNAASLNCHNAICFLS